MSVNQFESDPVMKDYLINIFQMSGLLKSHACVQGTVERRSSSYSASAPRRVKFPLLPKLKQELQRSLGSSKR